MCGCDGGRPPPLRGDRGGAELGDAGHQGDRIPLLAFAGLTGDFYDLHVGDDYARSLGYPGKVAHGLLGLALADGLKNRSPLRLAAIVSLGWRWSFTGPILPEDRISATLRVNARRATRRPEHGIVTLGFDLRNQRGETVQRGENDMMVQRRPG